MLAVGPARRCALIVRGCGVVRRRQVEVVIRQSWRKMRRSGRCRLLPSGNVVDVDRFWLFDLRAAREMRSPVPILWDDTLS